MADWKVGVFFPGRVSRCLFRLVGYWLSRLKRLRLRICWLMFLPIYKEADTPSLNDNPKLTGTISSSDLPLRVGEFFVNSPP